jgi:hypothetical protein
MLLHERAARSRCRTGLLSEHAICAATPLAGYDKRTMCFQFVFVLHVTSLYVVAWGYAYSSERRDALTTVCKGRTKKLRRNELSRIASHSKLPADPSKGSALRRGCTRPSSDDLVLAQLGADRCDADDARNCDSRGGRGSLLSVVSLKVPSISRTCHLRVVLASGMLWKSFRAHAKRDFA